MFDFDHGLNLEPNTPEIITEGVIDVVSYYDGVETEPVIKELMQGAYVLIEDYYQTGLSFLHELKIYLEDRYNLNDYNSERKFRSAFKKASHRVLVMVENNSLSIKKAPKIGWLKEFYGNVEQYLLAFPNLQGLNSSWQWYLNGLDINGLNFKIHPYYGVYFPTRFDHIFLFQEWLDQYFGSMEKVVDVGIGSGILSFQMAEKGVKDITGIDINPNALINVSHNSKLLGHSENIKLMQSDLFENCDQKFDLIVFNPPWIPARHDLNEGIDKAIYYEKDFFEKFFTQAKDRLREDGKIVILFSNLGQITGNDVRHPIYYELQNNDRFVKDNLMLKNVKSGSKKTKRTNYRDKEKVELWVLSHNV